MWKVDICGKRQQRCDCLPISNMIPAVVCTAGNGVNGLAIVRSLGRLGAQVHVVVKSNINKNIAAKSKYCHSVYELRTNTSEEFMALLISIAKKCNENPVVFIDNDTMLNYLIECRNIEEYIKFAGHRECIKKLLDKKMQIEAAVNAGIDIPKSWFPNTWEDICRIKSKKVIAKKRFPVENIKNDFKIITANNGEELYVQLKEYKYMPNELLIQEYIDGPDDKIFFALTYTPIKGDMTFMVTGRKLVQSGEGDGGVMVLGESKYYKEISELTKKYIEQVQYKGYLAVEYKYSEATQKYYFIEVNPRESRFNSIAKSIGVDLTLLGYLDNICGKEKFDNVSYKIKEAIWVDAKKLMEVVVRRKEANCFLYLFKNLLRRKSWAVFALDDIKPWIAYYI